MPPQVDALIYAASIWVIPLIIAITFHEAAHGYVARFFGDNTAWQFGRVTLNPFKHIDPVGTILLPALLFLTRSPFLFGYAKPVLVNFSALRNPRRDMIWVAAAGPGMNLALGILAALSFPFVNYFSATLWRWIAKNLKNALVINVFLAIFNLLPLSGGLISYGINQLEQARPAASYVDRILRGANPGDLPVQLPFKYELVINLKTATSLGLTVSNSLQLLADRVIE